MWDRRESVASRESYGSDKVCQHRDTSDYLERKKHEQHHQVIQVHDVNSVLGTACGVGAILECRNAGVAGAIALIVSLALRIALDHVVLIDLRSESPT